MLVGLITGDDRSDKDQDIPTAEEIKIGLESRITVSDQNPGPIASLDSLTLEADSWVAIHEDNIGELGNILGASRFDSGEYVGAEISLIRGTIVGNTYYAVIYEDDGDRAFDHLIDMAETDESGAVLYKTFKTVSAGSRGEIEEE